ncbi:DUF305 domain-containing protein [Blastococcus xanthinilyticus]|uniref:Uncharacterized protein (DUF305 family) n=1 Tax=Blastococcus xanthinilyticus TaxID=1564164 RepID=A0A5S5CXX7_9ACTN|nr:DUF305 domain-containing protein [Blastococcus xanthinilyticus]TYP88640.1 uncharacterized protein (DUF305 family) [Blastococcus xanthinilyticus]
MTRTTARLVRLAGGLMAGAIVLAGCSNDGEGSSTASSSESSATADTSADDATAHNDADVAFVQGMLPHHEGALRMAQLADGRAYDPRVIDLANRIEAAQGPEIETMTGWLEAWGEPLPEDDMGGMDHGSGGMDMEGMTEEDMTALDSTSGAEFDRMFLEMMIPHHQGAVDMAETEIADGSNPDAVDMAREIVESQTAEIEEMQTLLTELGG